MGHYFLIETKLGKTYLTELHNEEALELSIEKVDDKEVLVDLGLIDSRKFITLKDAVIMVPRRMEDGKVVTIPVTISDAQMGSTRVVLATDIIAEMNVVDSGSDFITSLKAKKAGLVTSGSQAEIENSSRLIHKFSKR